MVNRNYVIDRLKSKTMKIDEFNFDRLWAPPIAAFFAPQDIAQLDYISKSLKYSARPREKYQLIDQIMRRRGFEKFIAGTNRTVYRCLENDTIVAKVAYDDVGRSDSVREFYNQMIFKPFVTKVFEYTPSGTLAIVERVIPITSREEFKSVASDIFEVINNWFIGEYVLEDIGTNFFQNWSIRKGFGPVLHDFPYAYKLDGNKLFCNKPDPLSPTGKCEGVIDYDAGYNFLHCTKCGALYRAKELEEAIKTNNVIVKSEGEQKMKIQISGGTNNVQREIVTGEYAGVARKTPNINMTKRSNPVVNKNQNNYRKPNYQQQVQKPQVQKQPELKITQNTNGVTKASTPIITPEEREALQRATQIREEVTVNAETKTVYAKPETSTTVNASTSVLATKESEDVKFVHNIYGSPVQKPKTEPELEVEEEVVEEKPIQAVSFNGQGTEPERSNIENFNYCLKRALEILDRSSEEEKDIMISTLQEGFFDSIEAAIERNEEIINKAVKEYIENNIEEITVNSLEKITFEYEDEDLDTFIEDIFNNEDLKLFCSKFVQMGFNNKRFGMAYVDRKYYYDEENSGIVKVVDPYLVEYPELFISKGVDDIKAATLYESDPMYLIMYDAHMESLGFVKASELPETQAQPSVGNDITPGTNYIGFKYYAAEVINVKDIFQSYDSDKVLVLVNEDGSYMNINGNIIGVDSINDKSVNALSIVSSKWLNGVQSRLEAYESDESEEEEEVVEEEVVDEDSDVVYKDPSDEPMQTVIPTGVLAPIVEADEVPVGVNGVIS